MPGLYELTDLPYMADIVDICTPPDRHFALTILNSNDKKWVFCEKPLVPSLHLLDTIAEYDPYHVMPIMQYRFSDGEPFDYMNRFVFLREPKYYVGWRGRFDTSGGGVIATHGPHIFDYWCQRMGPIKQVSAKWGFTYQNVEVESEALVTLTSGDVQVDIRLETTQQMTTPYGYKNSADCMVEQLRQAHASITKGIPLPVTTVDARPALEIVTACYMSILLGRPIDLPITKKDPGYFGWSMLMQPRVRQHRLRPESYPKIPV